MFRLETIIPFSRFQNKELITEHYREQGIRCHILLNEKDQLRWSSGHILSYPFITTHCYDVGSGVKEVLKMVNLFLKNELQDNVYYNVMADDDYFEPDFLYKLPSNITEPVVVVSCLRGDHIPEVGSLGGRHPTWPLYACPDNMKVCKVSGEQLLIKGSLFKTLQFGDKVTSDGELAEELVRMNVPIMYLFKPCILFNYLEKGRWNSFK